MFAWHGHLQSLSTAERKDRTASLCCNIRKDNRLLHPLPPPAGELQIIQAGVLFPPAVRTLPFQAVNAHAICSGFQFNGVIPDRRVVTAAEPMTARAAPASTMVMT